MEEYDRTSHLLTIIVYIVWIVKRVVTANIFIYWCFWKKIRYFFGCHVFVPVNNNRIRRSTRGFVFHFRHLVSLVPFYSRERTFSLWHSYTTLLQMGLGCWYHLYQYTSMLIKPFWTLLSGNVNFVLKKSHLYRSVWHLLNCNNYQVLFNNSIMNVRHTETEEQVSAIFLLQCTYNML